MAKPTAKQMIIIERLIMSMRKASERNKTKLLREEFVKMNKKYKRTHLPGEKSVSIGVLMKEMSSTKSKIKTGAALKSKVEQSNHNVK